jgi:hypothetical protein
MVTGDDAASAPEVTDPTPLPARTPVSQRHCQRDPDLLVEHATATREVNACLDDAVKYAAVAGFTERAA